MGVLLPNLSLLRDDGRLTHCLSCDRVCCIQKKNLHQNSASLSQVERSRCSLDRVGLPAIQIFVWLFRSGASSDAFDTLYGITVFREWQKEIIILLMFSVC